MYVGASVPVEGRFFCMLMNPMDDTAPRMSHTEHHPVRVRFAPSPTGFLHVGGLRTALYNYLFARHHGGTFILRIEDTDQSRMVEGAVDNLIATLKWTGIQYDEGIDRPGPYGPYVQSERLDLYRRHAEELLLQGRAYHCFCTPERLEQVRQQQSAAKLQTSYDRHCRSLTRDEVNARLTAGERHVIRMKVPLDGELSFQDAIRGTVTFAYQVLDDQVLLKSDGFPTYHLAVVVDDHHMRISHVIRGEEWLPSTPKHILLFRAFGWEPPVFAHLPLLLNPDKSKLSKRQGDVAVEEYRAKGYLREALTNFVALLGWNPGDEREIFSMEELVGEFSLERVGKSGSIFNVEKLNWLNFEHLRRKPDAEVLSMVREHLATTAFAGKHYTDEYLAGVILAMRDRVSFVQEFVTGCPYFFAPPAEYDPAIVKKRWKPETPELLKRFIAELEEATTNPSKEEFEAALHRTAESANVGNGQIIHAIRLAVSGVGAGPGLYDILYLLGKEETIRRIKVAVATIV